MASYTFNTNILSASQVGIGNPTAPTDSFPLTAAGIGILALSSTHDGLAFNSVPLSAQVVRSRVRSSVFNINSAYHNQPMALIEHDGTYTVFTYSSSAPNSQVLLLSGTRDVSIPEQRRKWVLGYF
jgi:hypothetical protein